MSVSGRAAPETWLFLSLGGIAVAAQAMEASALSADNLAMILCISVATAGLPHGALDPWIARQAGIWRTPKGFAAFNLAYIGLVGTVGALWWLAPAACLAAFLALSAWHFGGDWRKHLPPWARLVSGVNLLALPAWRWPAEVREVFTALSGPGGAFLADGLAAVAPWLTSLMAAVVLLVMRRSSSTAVELVAVTALALLLPPLAYFVVYFCALHSMRHLRIAMQSADTRSRRNMVAVASIYTALTLILTAALWIWLKPLVPLAAASASDLWRVVFIGLLALTLPHMLVVMRSEDPSRATV